MKVGRVEVYGVRVWEGMNEKTAGGPRAVGGSEAQEVSSPLSEAL